MLRIFLIDIFLFLLPFLIYAAYMIWVKGVLPQNLFSGFPFFQLLLAGGVCLFVGLFLLATFTGGDRDGTYQPSVLEDGIVKPGSID